MFLVMLNLQNRFYRSPCPPFVTLNIFTGEMYPRFTMILGGSIVDPAVFEHNSVKYSPFSTNHTSTPWSGIGVKLEYVMCEHWFIESLIQAYRSNAIMQNVNNTRIICTLSHQTSYKCILNHKIIRPHLFASVVVFYSATCSYQSVSWFTSPKPRFHSDSIKNAKILVCGAFYSRRCSVL